MKRVFYLYNLKNRKSLRTEVGLSTSSEKNLTDIPGKSNQWLSPSVMSLKKRTVLLIIIEMEYHVLIFETISTIAIVSIRIGVEKER